MPPKKDNQENYQERLIQTRQEVMIEVLNSQLTEKMDNRFAQMQETMAAIADKVAQLVQPPPASTESQTRSQTEPSQSTC